MEQKPYTQYECASGHTGLGHSSLYTGAYPSNRSNHCACGQPYVEVVPDGFQYKVVFESIDPFQAAEMVERRGKSVWMKLTEREWSTLRWLPPITSTSGSANSLRGQYLRLLEDSHTHEQPIRNVHFYRAAENTWEPVAV